MDGLPGAELITKGLEDLARGEETVESLLVSIGAPKLHSLGLLVARYPAIDPKSLRLAVRNLGR